MPNSGAIAWQAAYDVGDAEIDAQHRELFATANSLIDARSEPGSVFLKLHELVRSHFSHEESVMRRIRYPGFLEHERHHDRLAGLLRAVRSEIAGGDWGSDTLRTFFNGWLVDHIVKQDSCLANYIRAAAAGDLGDTT